LVIGVRLVLAAMAGRDLPLWEITALVVVPVLVAGGGFLAVRRDTVSPELIERVRSGKWDAGENTEDREDRNAFAARG
jgi:hypothetical protein